MKKKAECGDASLFHRVHHVNHPSPQVNTRSLSIPRFGYSSESDTSPRGTPEAARKHLKSIGASAKRSMSFLHKKKKHENRFNREDIQHHNTNSLDRKPKLSNDENNPQRLIQTLPTEEIRLKPKRDSQRESLKSRPKSQVINVHSTMANGSPYGGLQKPRLSFEI